ncbi:hypothetical protein RI129_003985 [Pyrocoelia pectoralis]|uniref:Uncharacterized protein n=1 Tax=Pyrocoelia pectoralis TaxID=417401 RepID=A0AAN7VTG7_9COLE
MQSEIGGKGELHKNNNRDRLLQLCTENNLIIMNTFFMHKDIHKYTREAPSRNEKSIVDYIVTNKPFRKEIKDVKVRKGAEIYSDHYLVIAKIYYIPTCPGAGYLFCNQLIYFLYFVSGFILTRRQTFSSAKIFANGFYGVRRGKTR